MNIHCQPQLKIKDLYFNRIDLDDDRYYHPMGKLLPFKCKLGEDTYIYLYLHSELNTCVFRYIGTNTDDVVETSEDYDYQSVTMKNVEDCFEYFLKELKVVFNNRIQKCEEELKELKRINKTVLKNGVANILI